MLDENSKQKVQNHINTICKTALAVIDTLGIDEETDLVDRLEKTAEAIATHYDMEPELMEEYRAIIAEAKIQTEPNEQHLRYADAENAKDMIYTLCDGLDDPKEIMCHVRTADEMLAVWEAERNK